MHVRIIPAEVVLLVLFFEVFVESNVFLCKIEVINFFCLKHCVGLSDACKHVIHYLGYSETGYNDDTNNSDKEVSMYVIAVEPEEVVWLKVMYFYF